MILTVDNVSFQYKSTAVLDSICFQVPVHNVVAVLGPNGVGKTTLLRCMNAILRPKSGVVRINGENILNMGTMEIARRMGYVAQRAEAARTTVFDAILLGRRPHITWRASEHDLRLTHAAIDRLGLNSLSLRYVTELSGGELQKVSIARALVQEPGILLLDEPTSSLDLKNQIEILKTIRQVAATHEVAAVMTMHNLNMALRYADQFIFLKAGRIFAAGGAETVTPEIIGEVYDVAVDITRHRGAPMVVPLG
ncbi:iron complex transport system ATP-binding protein [Desulfosalsimonas propionicica]|uniref:Iron complex transport system ATP-binding protein n=1 Tax=Desulfosalsimonas propionicica TaxID=332175 RepID=A0A7W0C8G1_9BACT|nr:ABC transporter ATP-binding protein [Desulfosalsimonas propionicica]MBA2880989.1 iron complex transport system ATP-binding protein [Desulfosalsimonas propionicica]